MSIFNLFRKEQAPSSQTTPTQAPETNNVERKQTVDEPIQQKASTQSIPDGTKRVHNLIILDESGSMSSIYRPALTGVNETLQTIRSAQEEHQNQQHFVTLVAFDSGHYNQSMPTFQLLMQQTSPTNSIVPVVAHLSMMLWAEVLQNFARMLQKRT